MARKLKVGSLYPVWWYTGDKNPNMATVIAVLSYTGIYKQYFNAVLRLTAPNTRRGWTEMAVKL